MIEIKSTTEAIKILEKVVAIKGKDYIDPSVTMGECEYQKDGVPSCIVGNFLFEIGVGVETLEELDSMPDSAISSLKDELEANEVYLSQEVLDSLSSAQCAQDEGATWGDALKAAKS